MVINYKKKILVVLWAFAGVLLCSAAAEGDWYISNATGMLLEKTYKTRAMRSNYAVQLQNVRPENVPKEIRKYYAAPWKVECRILYEKAKRFRTQWVYKDAENSSFFLAVVNNDGAGFLEWYDDKGYVIEEQRLDADGGGFFVSYTYKDRFLLKAEAHLVESVIKPKPETEDKPVEKAQAAVVNEPEPPSPLTLPAPAPQEIESAIDEAGEIVSPPPPVAGPDPMIALLRNPQGPAPIPEFFVAVTGREGGRLWTDDYRYSRTNTLRAIERKYFEKTASKEYDRLVFPRFVLNSPVDREFVSPGISISSSLFPDTPVEPTAQLTYTLDTKQRILTETRRDEEGKLIEELTNTWKNDKIEKITRKYFEDERVVTFGYNGKGDRVSEQDYRNDILERTVTISGSQEIEELYFDGKPVLRAVWEDGKKISEERL
ncbi:MAG: hypothetical protein LBT01_02210 [Spirochaetaceae bacterium]|jgi:hypothetical protein|nr:hypothetical protein [Spirochaetaceae bacterium]